jgi:ABC-type phosphate transport system substrate-binding protein
VRRAAPSARLRGAVLGALAACLLAAGTARAEDIAVVANPALPAERLDLETLKKVFLGEKDYLDGIPVHPVDYRDDRKLRDGFLRATLGISCRAYDSYWVKEVFRSGHFPPVRVDDADGMLKNVATDPGAVGYVPVAHLKGVTSVRTVLILSIP